MREKETEQKLIKAVKDSGGMCLKFISPGTNGVPDRIALLPEGHLAFIEVKRPGEKPRALQLLRHRQLEQLGFQVFVLDDPDAIDGIIERIKNADNN